MSRDQHKVGEANIAQQITVIRHPLGLALQASEAVESSINVSILTLVALNATEFGIRFRENLGDCCRDYVN